MIENLQEDRKRQVITDFSGGLHDSIDPIKLEENQFQVMNNAVMFHHTGVKSLIGRNGFRPFNTKAPATGSVTSVINVHEYIKNDGTAVLLAKTNLSLEKIASPYSGTSAWTAIDGSDSADKPVKMLTYKDLAYIFDRNNGSTWYINKVYNGTTLYDFGIAPADLSNITIDTVSSAMAYNYFADGYYNYLVTFLYDDNTESSVYTDFELLTSTLIRIGVTGGKTICINLKNIPIGNTRVVARKIYRTKVDSYVYYYLNTIWNNTDTNFEDSIYDDDMLTEEINLPFIGKPMIAKCAVVHKKRLFNANLKENLTLTAPTIVTPPSPTTDSRGMALSKNTTLKTAYKYAKMYVHPYVISSSPVTSNYGVIIGDLSSAEVVTLPKDSGGTLYGKVTHTVPVWTEPFNGYTGIYRTPHYAIVEATFSSSVWTIKLRMDYPQASPIVSIFSVPKVGDTVYIHDIDTSIPEGSYIVTTSQMGATYWEITIDYDTAGVTPSATDTGGVYITNKYKLVTIIKSDVTTFVDNFFNPEYLDSVFNSVNSVTNQTSNKNYPQTIIWTDSEKSEIFTGEDLLNNETGAITGLFSEDDGVVIFKEDSIYKLFTNGDSQYWVTKQLVKNIGCSLIYSVVQLPNNKYIFFSNNKFYLWSSGFNDPVEISLPIRNALNSLALTDVYGAYYGKLNWAVFTTSNVNTVFVYDLNFNKWYKFTNNTFTGGASLASLNLYIPYETKAGTLLLGSKVARLYNYDLTSYVDNLYNESFIDCPTHFKLQTKDFDNYFLDIDKIMAKMYYSGTKVTSGFIMTPHKNLVAGADITKDIANGNSRVGGSVNIQDTQQFSILTEGNISNLFELKGLAFEYTDKGVEGGWYYES